MNIQTTIQAEPPLLAKARSTLEKLQWIAASDSLSAHDAKRVAGYLESEIELAVEHELPILRGKSPNCSSLAFFFKDWGPKLRSIIDSDHTSVSTIDRRVPPMGGVS